MSIAVLVLFIVLAGILLRKLSPWPIPIWLMMSLGAVVVLVAQQITLVDAFHAVNFNVIGYLFGVFVIGQALEESGYLAQLSYHLFRHTKNVSQLLFSIIFMGGITSAFLMNDTIAIIGTPIILHIARYNKIDHKPLLIALAFSITIGSVMSPIGNPQNLLIAVHGSLTQPFLEFFKWLLLPTIICLFAAYGIVRFYYRKNNHTHLHFTLEPLHNPQLTRITQGALGLMGLLIILKIMSAFWKMIPDMPFSFIAILSALPILLLSRQRMNVLRKMDWTTILFFIAMFILMQSVWESGVFQSLAQEAHINIAKTPAILGISAVMSQLISNVPLVALYLPLLKAQGAGTAQFMALAAGSTIAGNLFIIGAASNIIIIQNTERRGYTAFSVLRFAAMGIPLSLVNLFVYWLFL